MTGPVAGPGVQAAAVRRVLPAVPDVVYGEWTEAAALADWMCPRPARCRHVEADPRIGGRVRFDIEEDGTEFTVTGEYLVLDRPRRVSFSWSCSTWPDPLVRSVVDVRLEPHGPAATLMTITHLRLPPGLAGQHERGWAAIGGQLAARLAATPGPRPLLFPPHGAGSMCE